MPNLCAAFVLTNGTIGRVCAIPGAERKLRNFWEMKKSRFLAHSRGDHPKKSHFRACVKGPKFVLHLCWRVAFSERKKVSRRPCTNRGLFCFCRICYFHSASTRKTHVFMWTSKSQNLCYVCAGTWRFQVEKNFPRNREQAMEFIERVVYRTFPRLPPENEIFSFGCQGTKICAMFVLANGVYNL